MRILLLFTLSVVLLVTTQAQNLDVTTKESCSVIIPTIKTLKTLCKLSENEFAKIMIQNKYQKDSEFSSHKAIAYTNGNLDPIILKCFNTYSYNILNNSIECMIPTDMVYPKNTITNLVNSLKPYYTMMTNDGFDVFKDDNYIIAIKQSDKFYRIVATYKK